MPRRGGPSVQDRDRPERVGVADVGQATVDCAVYDAGERRGGRLALEEALEVAAECRDGFVWMGLHDPTPEVVELVGERFQLPGLAVEDAVHAHQRAKLEHYGDLLFMVLKTARYVDSEELIEIGEIMVFVSDRFIIAVRHGEGTPLTPVRQVLEAHPDLLKLGPGAVLYGIADRVVDDYATVIDGVDVDIAQVEAEVFSDDISNPARRIYRLKREVLEFRRAVVPLVDPVQRLVTRPEGPIDERTIEYFRDVLDHLTRDVDRISAHDELLTGALQANLAQLSVRDNQDMRKISAVVAILAVPTMVFGLYGMNFEHMPELEWNLGYPVVLLVTALICLLVYRRFKRAGWL
ncbi:MAG: magnesium and cobalt transport protein CorA [Solirubrobacterales bacterium]|nr:magnesium and cobalt transport protein CorA [Solirubrobacterales bacterium]